MTFACCVSELVGWMRSPSRASTNRDPCARRRIMFRVITGVDLLDAATFFCARLRASRTRRARLHVASSGFGSPEPAPAPPGFVQRA